MAHRLFYRRVWLRNLPQIIPLKSFLGHSQIDPLPAGEINTISHDEPTLFNHLKMAGACNLTDALLLFALISSAYSHREPFLCPLTASHLSTKLFSLSSRGFLRDSKTPEWSSTNKGAVRGSIPQLLWPSLGKFGSSCSSFTWRFLEGWRCRWLSGVVSHLVLAFFPSFLTIRTLQACFVGSTSEWLAKPSLVSGSLRRTHIKTVLWKLIWERIWGRGTNISQLVTKVLRWVMHPTWKIPVYVTNIKTVWNFFSS